MTIIKEAKPRRRARVERALGGALRMVLIAVGILCVMLGALGIVLPLLPTTPFLLLAACCFGRSSPRFYTWLHSNRWFGSYLRNYRAGRGISRKHKQCALLLLWLAIGYSVLQVVDFWWAKAVLLGIALAVTVHLLRLPTLREKGLSSPEPRDE